MGGGGLRESQCQIWLCMDTNAKTILPEFHIKLHAGGQSLD